jgi:hypothetical protein
MNTYNPFATAFSAAIAELTSPEAKRYYSSKVQQDIQTVFLLVVQFGCMAYELGCTARQWMDEYNAASVPTIEEAVIIEPQPLLMAAPVLLALPEVTLPHPDRERVLRRIAKVTALSAVGTEVLITSDPGSSKAKRTPKARTAKADPKTAKPFPRKAPTTVKSKSGALIAKAEP